MPWPASWRRRPERHAPPAAPPVPPSFPADAGRVWSRQHDGNPRPLPTVSPGRGDDRQHGAARAAEMHGRRVELRRSLARSSQSRGACRRGRETTGSEPGTYRPDLQARAGSRPQPSCGTSGMRGTSGTRLRVRRTCWQVALGPGALRCRAQMTLLFQVSMREAEAGTGILRAAAVPDVLARRLICQIGRSKVYCCGGHGQHGSGGSVDVV